MRESMDRQWFLFLLVVVVFSNLLIGATPLKLKKNVIHDDTVRIKTVSHWITIIDTIAKIGDPRVTEINNHIKRNFVVARPTNLLDLSILAASAYEGTEKFAIVPLYPEDMMFPSVKQIKTISSGGNCGAVYIRSTKTLWVANHEGISNTFMGVILIHEGEHILQDRDSRFANNSQVSWCMGEYFAFITSLNALRILGGATYEQLIVQDVKRMVKEYRSKKKFQMLVRYDHHYDTVFGVPDSENEERVRALNIIMTSLILSLKEVVPKGKNYDANIAATFCNYYAHVSKTLFTPFK